MCLTVPDCFVYYRCRVKKPLVVTLRLPPLRPTVCLSFCCFACVSCAAALVQRVMGKSEIQEKIKGLLERNFAQVIKEKTENKKMMNCWMIFL